MASRLASGDPSPAILLDVNLQALKVARSLGRRGVPVYAIAFEAGRAEHACRFLRDVEVRPEARHDEAAMLAAVRELGNRLGGRPVLVPMTDDTVLFVARNEGELADDFAFSIPAAEVLEKLVTKAGMAELADRAGVAQPRTFAPADDTELHRALVEAQYPVIIKPVLSTSLGELPDEILNGVMNGKVARASDPAELLEKWRAIAAWEPELVIQEEVVGPDENLLYYVGYFDSHSEPRASFVGVKNRLLPIHYGSASTVLSVENPAVVEQSVHFMRAIGYRGHVGIEYKYDPRDGEYKLIEVNARFGLWDGMAARCGIDFAWLNYALLTGRRADAPDAYRTGVKWISMQREAWTLSDYLREGELSPLGWLRQMVSGPRDWAVFAADDPLPFLLSSRDLARQLGGGIWRRLRGGAAARSRRRGASGSRASKALS